MSKQLTSISSKSKAQQKTGIIKMCVIEKMCKTKLDFFKRKNNPEIVYTDPSLKVFLFV